ncbi:hypothetical protein [Rhizobium leguminosarum]|uniref:hypothetical protein n=1 Tax=Rhizobium leguminosarum TaxID=384 RepID=UPI0021BBF9B5|nr:hypothetical protein [Rhizobium leguminosarum]
MSLKSFISGGDTGQTQDDISDQRKRLAYAMLQQGMESGPVQSPWQGAARLVQALMGGLAIRRQEQQASGDGSAAPAGDPGYYPFAPLPDNGPVPTQRPYLDPLAAADDRRGQPMAPAAQPGDDVFGPLPDNVPIPTQKPYRDPMITTDDRAEQPMAPAAQPGDNPFAPLPDNGPAPTPRPAYRAPAASAPNPSTAMSMTASCAR